MKTVHNLFKKCLYSTNLKDKFSCHWKCVIFYAIFDSCSLMILILRIVPKFFFSLFFVWLIFFWLTILYFLPWKLFIIFLKDLHFSRAEVFCSLKMCYFLCHFWQSPISKPFQFYVLSPICFTLFLSFVRLTLHHSVTQELYTYVRAFHPFRFTFIHSMRVHARAKHAPGFIGIVLLVLASFFSPVEVFFTPRPVFSFTVHLLRSMLGNSQSSKALLLFRLPIYAMDGVRRCAFPYRPLSPPFLLFSFFFYLLYFMRAYFLCWAYSKRPSV